MNKNQSPFFLCVTLCTLWLFLIPSMLSAQGKFALVIGNGNYIEVTKLNNPINDANDMANVLEDLGFTVNKILDSSLNQMEEAVISLQNQLSESKDSYGFFFFSGHGVQSHGVNYLLPVDANIPGESFLHNRALSMQAVLDALNNAGNKLNIVILDACRDNPFSWSRLTSPPPVTRQSALETSLPNAENQSDYTLGQSRSISGGHSSIIRQPAGSIVVYATSAGEVAGDGFGRNGLFTTQLLKNLTTPGLEVSEIFRRTGADVRQASGGRQIPAVYNQFFDTAYLIPPPRDTHAQLWSVGVLAGSSFASPWIVTTVRGTIAPFDYSFLALGADVGFVSGTSDVGLLTICPFVHFAFFLPFDAKSNDADKANNSAGWYIGAGGGYMMTNYSYPEGKANTNSFVMDVFTGLMLFNFLDISYTLRTNFNRLTNKISIGYLYRW
ncbi:MAG: caspase family protein [Treponema sp.]|nr:caspase family protein [Treponema sp.]